MGLWFATQRPKQTAFAVLGLLVGTAVVVAAGVTGDSVAESTRESVLADLGSTDVVVESTSPVPETLVHEVFADPQLARATSRYAVAYRTTLTVVDTKNLQSETGIPLWGVDPSQHRALGSLVSRSGSTPQDLATWKDHGFVLNALLAHRLGAAIGDTLSIALKPFPGPPPTVNNTTGLPPDQPYELRLSFNGTLEATAQAADGSYVHSSLDRYSFNMTMPAYAYHLLGTVWSSTPVPGLGPDFDLEITFPNGTALRDDDGSIASPQPPFLQLNDTRIPPGAWNFKVHAKQAVNQSFRLNVTVNVNPPRPVLPPPPSAEELQTVEWRGPLLGLVENRATDPLQPGPAAFVSLRDLQEALNASGRVNVILVSAAPGTSAATLRDLVQAKLSAAGQSQEPGSFQQAGFDVRDVRTRQLASADQAREDIQFAFLLLGAFPMMAGAMLIVSLMGLLVEERRVTLATMRATGATRMDVTQSFLVEATLYALAATIAGVVAGILLSSFLIHQFDSGLTYTNAAMRLHLDWDTVVSGAGFGFALTVLLVAVATYALSRFNVARALRGEEAISRKERRHALVLQVLSLAAGVVLMLLGVVGEAPVWLVLGPCLLAVGGGGLLAQRLPKSVAYPIAAGALFAYVVASHFFLTGLGDTQQVLLFPVRGFALIACATVFLIYMDLPARAVAAILRPLPPLRPIVDWGIGYGRDRPRRTALTVAMIALAVLTLVIVNILFGFYQEDPTASAGGFDVIASSQYSLTNLPAFLQAHPPPTGLDPMQGIDQIGSTSVGRGSLSWATIQGQRIGSAGRLSNDVLGVDEDFVRASHFGVTAVASEYGDLAAAMRAVTTHRDVIVVSDQLRYGESRPLSVPKLGEELDFQIRDQDQSLKLKIIAFFEGGQFGGVFVHPNVTEQLAGGAPYVGTRLFIKVKSGEDSVAVAQRIEGAFRDIDMDAVSVRELARKEREQANGEVLMVQVFVGVGLIVGVASVGILSYRNVLERKREIGTLRALGARPWHIQAAFALEVLFLVTAGLLVGLASGLVTAYGFYTQARGYSEVQFDVNWANLGLIFLIEYAMALLAALLPAWWASRTPPAQATAEVE